MAIEFSDGDIKNLNTSVITSGKIITPTVTVKLTAYHANDNIGGKLTITDAVPVSGGSAILDNLTVLDADKEKAELYILIFNSNPAAATLTDDAAVALSTDLTKVIAVVHVAAADYVEFGTAAIAHMTGLKRVVQASGSANLYAAIMCVGTPTYTAATDLTLKFGFSRR